jgi:putative ABC transport system permease protein
MLKNYLRITYRNLIKYKSYSSINIFGLSLGIACCILIYAYIGYELSYDRYHKNAENIYRIVSQRVTMGKTSILATTPAPVGPTMVKDFPEVLDAVRFSPTVKRIFTYQDKSFFQDGVLYADPSVFKVFSFELIEGDPETALEVPFTMILAEKTARKIFGNESPVGKIINWDNKFDYQITGVVKDPPPNSHFTFDVLASFATFMKYDPRIGSWRGGSFQTYLHLQKYVDPKQFEQKFKGFCEKYLGPMLREQGIELEMYLQPLKSIHLHSRLEYELGINSDIKIIYAFSAIAIMILITACINFMNLATARAMGRAKEVVLRKVLGAERGKIVLQFLGESFMFALFSLVIAIILARLFLPYFNLLASREISLNYLDMPYIYAGLVGILIFVGFGAGSYPAFFLSAFKPISVLRGSFQKRSRSSEFRSVLVVFQFAISAILIICTLIVFNQHKYIRNKDLGFDEQNLLVIALQNREVRIDLESFKDELLKISGVVNAGASSMVPGEMYLFTIGTRPERFSKDQVFRMDNFLVDYGFLDTFKIEIVQGRGFSKEMITDVTDAIMINETAARKLEWDNPVGKTIEIPSPFSGETVKKSIIGVFRDIHQRSLYSAIAPTVIEYISNEGAIEARARRLTLRLNTDDLSGTMAKIEQKWKEVYPSSPYFSFFLDGFFNSQHRAEGKLGSIFRSFSILAVIIGCLGLFGLVSFTAGQRTKEIGIRKVLGSTVISIVVLLCRKFIFLVTLSNIIAWPIAFFVMKKWLQNFPYSANLRIEVFAITAMLTFAIALLTVGYQSLKAALANPVDSLRYE